ncbi:unnamed protein product [Polarella glacialis]|uniref:SSD domain-containing protein n=2 Tax=Polarella glacialis TaxID=89957 RepID=A0A813KUL9_POLGL|nr:unnamed protein product [Polarella glacialis]
MHAQQPDSELGRHINGDAFEVRASAVAHPKVAAFVDLLKRPLCKTVLVTVWLGLNIGGLAVLQKFVTLLESSIPPVEGTPSYDAAEKMGEFFPLKPLNGAFLVRSADGSALLDFVNRSTCTLNHTVDTTAFPNVTIHITCPPNDLAALGDGCITKSDLLIQTAAIIANISSKLPLPSNVTQGILGLLNQEVPNITRCPIATAGSLTADWLSFATSIGEHLGPQFPNCQSVAVSFASLPAVPFAKSFVVPVFSVAKLDSNLSISMQAMLPKGELWELFENRFMSDSLTTSLLGVSTSSCDGHSVGADSLVATAISSELQVMADQATRSLNVRLSSQTLMLAAIKTGVRSTMDASSLTLPVALLILAGMVRNARLVLCTIINLIACVLASILFMFPVANTVEVSTTAPSLMIAVALAMSIDYSLFLLTRFHRELADGRELDDAVTIMLATSGRIVLVSGLTLLLCFLTMQVLPVKLISSMGISAAITVGMAVAAALTLTPTLLLLFPSFFASSNCYGLSSEGCCFRGAARAFHAEVDGGTRASEQQLLDRQAAAEEQRVKTSCWPGFGKIVQRLWVPVLVLLLAIAFPLGLLSLPRFQHSCGLVPLMPYDATATHSLLALQDSFGVGALFPTTILLVPPQGSTDVSVEGRNLWLQQVCQALKSIAVDTDSPKIKAPPFTSAAFSGAMIMNGSCTTSGSGLWSNVGGAFSATQVSVNYLVDPFSSDGQVWIDRLRDAVSKHSDVGTWHIAGEGPNQMDVANKTFSQFPVMIALMMIVVLVLMAVSFKSVVAPLRAVFCLLWMLTVTFGFAIFTFQDGCLDFLNFSQLCGRSTGAMHFMSLCIAFPVVVGLGLDYDIFYSERVVEERSHGHPEQVAAVRGLAATANTITAAGFIMAAAFMSLLLSTTPTLNEIAFLLIIGVLIDCAITTKIVIPSAMGMLGKSNFWPRKFAMNPEDNGISLMAVQMD